MTSGEREHSSDDWERLPGLFYEEEIAPILLDPAYRIEQRGRNDIGLALFAVYHRLPKLAKDDER